MKNHLAGALAMALSAPGAPATAIRYIRAGGGQRNLLALHRKIAAADRRGYDIHKIGAKDRARMEFPPFVERDFGSQ